MSVLRHPATVEAWKWLEEGDGIIRPGLVRAQIRLRLKEIDAILIAWEAEFHQQLAALDIPTDSDGVCGCVREWMG